MSTTTDVVPGAGWYRDPSNPSVARWWDGSTWGPQTQALPPLEVPVPAPLPEASAPFASAPGPSAAANPVAAPVPAPAQPMIAVAEPVLAPLAFEPLADTPVQPKAGRKLPSLRLPRVALPGNPLVALLLILVLVVGGWFAWKTLHGSSAPAAAPQPVATHAASKAAPKPVHLPNVAPTDLAGVPRRVDPVSRSLAAHVIADQRRGGHHVIASFYGQTSPDQFFFLGSNVVAADRKHVAAAVARGRLVHLLEAATGDSVQNVAFIQVENAGVVQDCVSGKVGAATETLCSWQNASTRLVVVRSGSVAPTQLLLAKVHDALSK